MCACSGLYDRGVAGQPSVFLRTLHIIIRDETEGEVKSRCISSVGPALAHETGFRHEARNRQRVGLAVGHLHTTEHRTYISKHISGYLCRLALVRVASGNGDSCVRTIGFRRDADLGVSCRFEGYRNRFAGGVRCRDSEQLAIQTVRDLDGCAFGQRHRLGVRLGFERPSASSAGMVLGHRLPVFRFAVPGLEVDAAVHLPCLQAADGVAAVHTGGGGGGACPAIGCVIRCVGAQCVQTRDAVERHVP